MTHDGQSDNQSKKPTITNVDLETLTAPPSRVQLAALMAEAEESAPHSQSLIFALPGNQRYLLTITYLTRATAEPTWVLSTEGQDPPKVFWSITTENPEQIYNMLIKRARNPEALRSYSEPASEETGSPLQPLPNVSQSSLRGIPQAQPSGYFFKDRYEVVEEIGCGGMSRVYRANDTREGKPVAVKVLHQHLLKEGRSKNPKKRFEQEFKATMALGHDNIVNVLDHGFTTEGLPFMVMEFIDGHSLEQYLRANTRLKLEQFLTTFYQTCSALSHAHSKGIIHRDVKPSNIMMITENNVEKVKLLDFGIAKIHREQTEDTAQKLTQTGDVFGSPYYMSPEQCKGEALDERSDIYSLGCVMYQAITGKRPFEGDNAYKTIYMHVNIRPQRFKAIRPDMTIPERIERVIMRSLEKDPAKRYQTSRELSLELQRLAQNMEDDVEEEDWVTRQTRSGTFYAVHPTTGKEEPAAVGSVLKLLLHAGLVDNDEFTKASNLPSTKSGQAGRFLVDTGCIDNKTLHAAVKCQSLIERGELKLEKAVIALHYCQRSRIGLDEALEELGWNQETAQD